MDKTTEMDPVEMGSIQLEAEGEEEGGATAPPQVPAQESQESRESQESQQLQDGGNDPLMSLPMAELKGIEESQGKAEEQKQEAKAEQKQEAEEEEEEEEERQEGGDRNDEINIFYRDRKRYVLGKLTNKYTIVEELLKESGKVPQRIRIESASTGKSKKRGKKKAADEEYARPVAGPYFIVVKDSPGDTTGTELLYFPELTTYTATGDFELTKRSFRETIIEIPNYRPYTKDELFANFDKPDKAIKEAQIKYNTAHKNMLVALKEAGHPNLKNRMNELYEADEILSMTRFATRLVYKENAVPLNTLLFDRTKDTEGVNIGRFIGFKIPMEKRYVTEAAAVASSESENSTTPVIVINTPTGENGILSPFFQFAAPIMIDDVAYSCVYKAILSLLVFEVGPSKDHYIDDMTPIDNPDDLKEYDTYIREGENEKEIETKLSKVIPEVYQAALQQNPTMAKTLKLTGDALLVVVPQENPLDPFLGVGIDPNQTQLIQNPRKWTGQNKYGNVLIDLRQGLKQASVSEQVPVVEGSISLEEDDEIGEGSIPFGEEEEEEEEVPEIVLEGEEDGTKV